MNKMVNLLGTGEKQWGCEFPNDYDFNSRNQNKQTNKQAIIIPWDNNGNDNDKDDNGRVMIITTTMKIGNNSKSRHELKEKTKKEWY